MTLVNAVMKLRVPYNAGKFSIGCTTGGLVSSVSFSGFHTAQ
jgi:hypothetical protein